MHFWPQFDSDKDYYTENVNWSANSPNTLFSRKGAFSLCQKPASPLAKSAITEDILDEQTKNIPKYNTKSEKSKTKKKTVISMFAS